MGQKRNRTGIEFEKKLPSHFVRSPKSPKVSWAVGGGRNNMRKIVESGYDFKSFTIDFNNSNFNKYDWVDSITGDKYEVKKYFKTQLNKWTLYSEPYFKMSSKNNLNIIGSEEYNDFTRGFYEHNKKTGLFKKVIKCMTSETKDIYVQDGFIPMKDIEFDTFVVHNQWKGYDRITIMFKLKESK
jgi:hypothetical protein